LEVYGKGDKPLGQTTIHVASAEPWYWSVFAKQQGEHRSIVDSRGVRGMPRHDGGWAVWKLKLDEQPNLTDLDGLPCQILTPPGDKPPLTLTVKDKSLVVASGDKLLPLSPLLGRWWVNGVAVNVPPQQDALERHKAESGTTQAFALILPSMLGSLRVGDKIAVQVMRPPRGIRSLYHDMWPKGTAEMDWSRYPATPLLSNRLEFTVTQEMLK
jgi:hypothetical protein